jgi:hypothetical protein
MAVRSTDSPRMGLRMGMWATRGEQLSGSGSCVGCRAGSCGVWGGCGGTLCGEEEGRGCRGTMAVRSTDSAHAGLRMGMWATRGEQRQGSGSCVGCRAGSCGVWGGAVVLCAVVFLAPYPCILPSVKCAHVHAEMQEPVTNTLEQFFGGDKRCRARASIGEAGWLASRVHRGRRPLVQGVRGQRPRRSAPLQWLHALRSS